MKYRFASLLLGLVVSLLIAEIAVRIASSFVLPASAIVKRRTLADGPQISQWLSGGGNGQRILVVGDSFTFGPGVPPRATFPSKLARELESRRVSVVSYSRPGWNTRSELRALKEDFDRLDPDLFILAYCLNDAEPYPSRRMLADRPDLLPWRPEGFLETRLARYSQLFLRLRRATDSLRLRPALRDYYLDLYRDPDDMKAWRHALKRIRKLAQRRSLPSLLVVFPIFDSDLDSDYAYRPLHETVAQVGAKQGFLVLDLLPLYAGYPSRDLALVPFTDPHPSALAHSIAAREIARFLEAEGLVGPQPPVEGHAD